MVIKAIGFKSVVDVCYDLFREGELFLYASKFSNRLFTNFQHLFLLVWKEYRRFTYAEVLDDVAHNDGMRAYLGLKDMPHYTTLIKFAQRLPLTVLEKLVLAFRKLIPRPSKVAIDATGLSLDAASPHYCKRIGLHSEKRPFMKTTFIVDILQYIILLSKSRRNVRHDTIDAKPMLKKLSKYYQPDILYGDRGYDDEEIFRIAQEELNAYPLIFQKHALLPVHKKKGRYRKHAARIFDYGAYLKRNNIEAFMSVFKRRRSAHLSTKTIKTQKVSVYCKVIAHNIEQIIKRGILVLRITLIKIRVSY